MEILSLIGNTPLVEVTAFDTGPCRLFLKLENVNPGGSIKDRIALSMVSGAEASGVLKPGGTLVEATAGNTGLGLAMVAVSKGYRLVLVVPDKMSRDKIAHLRAMGTEVVLTRSDVPKGHPDYYQEKAEEIAAREPLGWYVNQFSNPMNPQAHELTTGPELWRQCGGELDAVVLGVGSGGTLGGLTRYFKRVAPHVEMVLADPAGSVIAPYVETGCLQQAGSWLVEGIGEDFIPKNADFSLVRRAYSIPDRESFMSARELLSKTGIFGGSSSGTYLAAALRYCREQTSSKRVVSFVCDGGNKYLSKMYSDSWMADQGFLARESYGDLRDLVSRPYASGSVVSVGPLDSLRTAYQRMKMYDVSQIPVLDGDQLVGVIDESDLLFTARECGGVPDRAAREVMSTHLRVLAPSDSLDRVVQLLKDGLVAIVADGSSFYGIITKIDVVDYLRRSH